MKYYNFILLTKRKRKKKELIRDKVKIDKTDMIVIKWERVWNDNREKKRGEGGGVRGRERWYFLQLQTEFLKRAKLLRH